MGRVAWLGMGPFGSLTEPVPCMQKVPVSIPGRTRKDRSQCGQNTELGGAISGSRYVHVHCGLINYLTHLLEGSTCVHTETGFGASQNCTAFLISICPGIPTSSTSLLLKPRDCTYPLCNL